MDNIIQYEKLEDYEKCDICRSRKAKYMCDYINGVLFDMPNDIRKKKRKKSLIF